MAPLDASTDADDAPEQTSAPAEKPHEKLARWIKSKNIATELDEQLLNQIGMTVRREYDIDKTSESDWRARTEEAVKIALQVSQEKMYPWPKASNVLYPLMTTASMQFAARAYPAIVSGPHVVRGIVSGDDSGLVKVDPATHQPVVQNGQLAYIVPPGAKRARANRVAEHMSWQLLEEQDEWEADMDKLVHVLPLAGDCYKKSYFDPVRGRNVSVMVDPLKMVYQYTGKSFYALPRHTEEIELYPIEIEDNERGKIFRPYEYGPAENSNGDDDAPHCFLEQHRWLDLDEDGYPEPYIVTVHKQTSHVARIVARYDSNGVYVRDGEIERIEPIHYYTPFQFLPSMDGGLRGTGFGNLLRPINEAINSTLNQMLDAGHLANTGGGLIGKGLSMTAGAMRFQPGEYKMVNVSGGTIRDNVFQFPWPGPSPVLFQLLGLLIEAGKEVAAIKDVLVGDQPAGNAPATTVLALIEQGLKVFTAIYKRIHRSLKQEYRKLYRLNRVYMPVEGIQFRRADQLFHVTQKDYADDMAVEPLSDPTMVSDMQRLARAQFLSGFANDPYCNGQVIRKRIFEAANIDKPEEILLPQPQKDPKIMAEVGKITARAQELKTDAMREKAAAARDYAQAILAMAQAASIEGAQNLEWLGHELEVMRHNLEVLNSATDAHQGQQQIDSANAQPDPGTQGA